MNSTVAVSGDAPGRIICILGMHRSGTSCLTGSLQEAGLHLGNCHTWNPYNLKGNRENQDFVDLHDDILSANGGSWDNPPGQVNWIAQHRARAQELLAGHQDFPVMGFKDPRTLLVLEGWKEISDRLEFVGTFRHPNAVAGSLQRRSHMPRSEALTLWYQYNKRLLEEYKARAFPVICFDYPEPVFQAKLSGIIEQLGLQRSSGDEQFYDNELKTDENDSGARLPWKIGRLYRRLCALSV
jgi:hypothetical protein